ncbi:MAG: DUF86 domain-containing protein [Thermomicrobiales bacterium]
MPSNRTCDYLHDVLDAIDHIEATVAGRNVDDYVASRDMRAIVERNLITVGEVLARLRDSDPGTIQHITSYAEAIGLRNIIIHEYRRLDDRQIWTTVLKHVPILAQECRALLEGES